jgi:hypothetical protein
MLILTLYSYVSLREHSQTEEKDVLPAKAEKPIA